MTRYGVAVSAAPPRLSCVTLILVQACLFLLLPLDLTLIAANGYLPGYLGCIEALWIVILYVLL